ncbi:hypothetical protein [Klebsiella michiganensis]|uniref:hypothetical protein n=1 Tax=Klebsiella michiganensis TaxID=1134687 RepID=UPI0027FCB59E|nr:hypothetical protein [Klebsiella michiganensis]MDQ7856497.1 hypothetical protein [Klebsiella michiganensis]
MSWFNDVFGFEESEYAATQARFFQEGPFLHTRSQPSVSYRSGILTMPSLAELRKVVSNLVTEPYGRCRFDILEADAYDLHRKSEVKGALIQVASQFNLLEMPCEYTTPEKGITEYQFDHTQGPACAMACAAATVFRNYLVPIGSQTGQSTTSQLNTLADMEKAIGIDGIRMKNGYALMSANTVQAISRYIASLDEQMRDRLRQELRIGLHSDTEVTIPGVPEDQFVSQALCSALPVAYNSSPREDWAPFASLVLEASYEATLLAGVLNYRRTGNPRVYVTMVGGGAFGNEPGWIITALRRALYLVSHHNLEVMFVSYRHTPAAFYSLIEEF